jgi:4'-phosphopantetheinyl transferase
VHLIEPRTLTANATLKINGGSYMTNPCSDPVDALAPGEIHLWLALYERCSDERLLGLRRELLNGAEREQESRFCFAADRRQYVCTRALVRRVLSRYTAVDPADWVFTRNAYGRPEIAHPRALAGDLSFNISHTRGLIVLAVARHGALGVDVENIATRAAALDIAERFFAPEEVAALTAVPPHQQHNRFFEYWTLKEAYVKARGMGFSLPLDQFSFHYPDNRAVAISIRPELTDDPARWQFWQIQPTPQYLVAVCAERSAVQPARLIVRVADPESSATPISPTLLRASQQSVFLRCSDRDRWLEG